MRRGTLVALGHGGSTAGYRTSALFHRRSKMVVVVLAGVAGGKLDVASLALRALEGVTSVKGEPAASLP